MIERHDTVLAEHTDEWLNQHATNGHWQGVYASIMLAAPPEYRRGLVIRASELSGLSGNWETAHRQALDELRHQPLRRTA